MPKIEEIRENYLKDADTLGSKSRFGYFSIPPCATAGATSFQTKTGMPWHMQSKKIKTEK